VGQVTKLVADAMTAEVSSVDTSAPVIEAARLMRSEDVGSVPIVDAVGHVTGIVTDRDIAVRLVAEGKDPTATGVSEVASGSLVTVTPEQELDEALNLMADHQVRRLPVVNESGALVGMLAVADVSLEAKEKKVGELVEEISQPTDTPRA
jgi:CBS domain-containing protein